MYFGAVRASFDLLTSALFDKLTQSEPVQTDSQELPLSSN